MKSFLIPILLLLFSLPVLSQQKAIELSKVGAEKVKTIQENKRIKVKTTDGEKHKGRFTIVNKDTIAVDDAKIALDSIQNLKRRSLVATIAGAALMVYGGIFILTSALTSAVSDGEGAAIGLIAGAAIGAGGFFVYELSPNHKQYYWTYKIVEE